MSDPPEDATGDRDADVVERDGEDETAGSGDDVPAVGDETGDNVADEARNQELEDLRAQIDEKYDFENFGPADMAEMSLEEWEVAFDPETWITGEELLDRLEDDLAARVASREVFARIERQDDPPRLIAYSDEGYAIVYPDGSVSGEGTVLRDVKPSVALSSMESYDVPEPPEDATLPEPEEVPEQSGELGNLMLQVIAGIQLVAALILFGAGVYTFGDGSANYWLLFAAGFAFLIVGLILFFTVANARLSDAFRAEEYRNRLRAVGTIDDGRPDFLPPEGSDADAPTETERTRPMIDRSDSATDDHSPGTTENDDGANR